MEQSYRKCMNCGKPFKPRPGKEDLDKFCLSCYLIFCKQKGEQRKEKAEKRELDRATREYQQPSLLPAEDEDDETTFVKIPVLPEQRKRLARLGYEKGQQTLTEYLTKLINAL